MIRAMQAKQTKNGILIRNDRYFFVPLILVTYENIQENKGFFKAT